MLAKTYCQRVDLRNYDTFLIFTATRFRRENSILAEAISSIGKKFFFVRSKIDQDVESEIDTLSTPESFNEKDFLENVRVECLNKLGIRLSNKQHNFLISMYPKKLGLQRSGTNHSRCFANRFERVLDLVSRRSK